MLKVLLVVSALLGGVLAILAIDPTLDVDIARAFFVGPEKFIGNTPIGAVIRYVAWSAPFALFALMVIAAIAGRHGLIAARWAPGSAGLLFCFVSLLLGPGVIVHATFKEVSHRPRPYSITEFGGPDRFRPFYKFDGACRHNCSFPSGETSAAAWTIAPASLAPPTWRAVVVAAALVFTAGTAFWRMAFGAHFLSDVLGAALMTFLVVLGTRALMMKSTGPFRAARKREKARKERST